MTKIRRSSHVVFLSFAWIVAHAQEASEPYDDPDILEQSVPVAGEPGILEQSVPVADEPLPPASEAATEPGVDAVPTEDALLLEHTRFMQLLEERNFDEADTAAKRIVEMAIRVYGPVSHETAKALNNLGYVQNNNGQYDAAIQNFTSAIEILETLEDRLNSSLINPLRGLGAAQLGGGRPDLAAQTFDRATHITHVNEGPHNIEQVEILEALAEADVRLGDMDAARDVLDRIHILNVRHFSDNALGLLPSLMRRADWQHRAGYYNDERATYRRAIRIIEESAGRDDPRLVDPLVRLGQSFYYFEPMPNAVPRPLNPANGGEAYLKRASKIAERNEDVEWLERAQTRLALADYYLSTESYSRARNLYGEIWNDLSADESRLDMRRELLENPVPIWAERLPPYTNGAAGESDRKDGEMRTGTVTVTFTVDRRGKARLQEIRTEPSEFSDMERTVERELVNRRYRPLIADGETVNSGTQTFTHEFRYTRTELEEIRASNADAQSEDENEKVPPAE